VVCLLAGCLSGGIYLASRRWRLRAGEFLLAVVMFAVSLAVVVCVVRLANLAAVADALLVLGVGGPALLCALLVPVGYYTNPLKF
jgi:hypothetical protein